MPQVKRAAKGKRPNKAVSVLGIAGMSLAASTSGSCPEDSFLEKSWLEELAADCEAVPALGSWDWAEID